MARKRVTLDNVPAVGDKVYTSRTGPKVLTVLDVEPQPRYPEAGPIIHAALPGRTWGYGYALSELWVKG